ELIRTAEERAHINEQQKIQAEEQLRTKDADNQRLQNEINQLRQIQAPSSATHSTQVIQPVVDRNATIEDNKSELGNPDPTGQRVRFERIQDLNRKAVALKQGYLSVSLNKVIKDGIHRIEVRFEKSNSGGHQYGSVGIVKAGYKIPYPCNSNFDPHKQNMLEYYGGSGKVLFKGTLTPGNVQFSDDELIAMELNADVGTLHFFVDGIQQPVFVIGIKEAVKFYFWTAKKDSSFSIVSVKKLPVPTAKTLPNEKVIQKQFFCRVVLYIYTTITKQQQIGPEELAEFEQIILSICEPDGNRIQEADQKILTLERDAPDLFVQMILAMVLQSYNE
ncbi:MAG: hypothetical protein EZS28_039604, partial [Streblomastix strix]